MTTTDTNQYVTVSSYPNTALARIACDRLVDAGIDARVEGDLLGAAAGAVALDQARPRVVAAPADIERASAILAKDLSAGAAAGPARACPACGADVEASFAQCWKCGADVAKDAPAWVPSANVPASSAAANRGPARAGASYALLAVAFVLAVVFAVASVVLGVRLNQVQAKLDTFVVGGPYGEPAWDGVCWRSMWSGAPDAVGYSECDTDGDGDIETTTTFRRDGSLETRSVNRGGRDYPSESSTFDKEGRITLKTTDQDQDGVVELTSQYDGEGTEYSKSFDVDEDGYPERNVYVQDNGNVETWLDTDHDGETDRVETAGATGKLMQVLVQTSTGWFSPAATESSSTVK